MATCVGETKAGKACKSKPFAGSAYCKVHDQNYKANRKVQLQELRERSTKTLEYIARRAGTKHLKEGEREEELAKATKHYHDEQILGYVSANIIPSIRHLALAGKDLLGYPKDQASFSRKVWMVISWHLTTDHQTYLNLAMSCKALYKVLVEDKVCHYVHPLKSIFTSPLLFLKPVYRILSLQVPDEFDNLMEIMKLPKVDEMMEVYAETYGLPSDNITIARRKSDIFIDLIKRMIKATMQGEDEFEESVEGAGIFDYLHRNAKFALVGLPHNYILHKEGHSTYLIVDAQRGKETDRLVADCLVPFDGHFLIQLMRV
jgi:hypothetical protein